MLDLDHPQSAYVFAASNELDTIRSYFSSMSWSDSKSRLSAVEIVRPCFVALPGFIRGILPISRRSRHSLISWKVKSRS